MKADASHPDEAPIILIRTGRATLAWYLRSKRGRALFFAAALLLAVSIVAASWPALSGWAKDTTSRFATGLATGSTPTVTATATRQADITPILDAQRKLSAEIEAADRAYADAAPYPELADHRAKVRTAIIAARKTRDESTSVTVVQRAAKMLHAAVGGLATKARLAKDAQVAAAARAQQQRAAAAEAARQAAQQSAAEKQRQGTSSSSGAAAPGAGTQQPARPAAPAPAPAAPAAPATARTAVTARCSTAASITFTASGGGTVSISAGGRTASGAGSASVSVSGGPGSYSASASASGSVRISFSSQGACS